MHSNYSTNVLFHKRVRGDSVFFKVSQVESHLTSDQTVVHPGWVDSVRSAVDMQPRLRPGRKPRVASPGAPIDGDNTRYIPAYSYRRKS